MKILKRVICVAVFLSLLLALGGCGTKKQAHPKLNGNFFGRTITYTFSAQPSAQLTLSGERAQALKDVIAQQTADYGYEDLYALEEVKSRLNLDTAVQSHRYSALDQQGALTASGLYQMVIANNDAFLADEPFGYKIVEDDYIAELCKFIVLVVDQMQKKYPDVDWPRVYCNLGNLKILYNTGMLSYAQVSSEMVLSISQNNTQIVLRLKGEDGFGRVLIHEIMHIIQIGCACEGVADDGRRAGIAMYWDDFTLNTTDWTWMVEGSAERHMCTLTGGESISYQYKMDYLCSMTLSVLLRDSVKADTMETLCFYSDPELLFETFDCQSQAQRDELLNLMITLQVLQMQPKSFHIAYKEKIGVDLLQDEQAMNQFSYALKPAVCITLAKEFYENLIPALQSGQLTCNDLFFLINLFEGHLNQHLSYANAEKAEINRPFISSYLTMREALFQALETDNSNVSVAALYEAYNIEAAGKGQLNAELSMLPEEKQIFLAERAQWQAELKGLGQKVMAQ